MSATQLVLPPLPTIKDLLRLYRIRALREMSQNFLLDERITNKIVKCAGNIKGGHIFEVGPGPGNITRSIIKKFPSSVTVVEKDKRFTASLEMLQESSPISLNIIYANILSLNMEALFPKELAQPWSDAPPNIHIIGNLPFNISTPLLIKWLRNISERCSIWHFGRVKLTLTFQKEVAERLTAPILTKQRCRLSLMAQNWCHIHHKFNIPGKAFIPKPKVDVGVVHFIPLISPRIDEPFDIVEKVTRCLFSFRQKYCYRGLGTLFPKAEREKLTEELLTKAEINRELRSFQLEHQDLNRLCRVYQQMSVEHPNLKHYNYREYLDAGFDIDLDEQNDELSLELKKLVNY